MQKDKSNSDMSIKEASGFWDEHDLFEFRNVKKINEIQFKLKKKKYIGVPDNLYKKINRKAKKMHKSCENLIEDWLKEKVAM